MRRPEFTAARAAELLALLDAGVLLLLGVPVAIVGGAILLVVAVGSLLHRRRRIPDG